MSRDLEKTLDEMGPEYRTVVVRLRMAQSAGKREEGRGNRGWLIAASLLVAIGLGVIFLTSQTSQTSGICAPREYRANIPEMIATQNPDGSWENDFLTRRNAAALKACSDPAARVAYKKAMRYLCFKGLLSTKG